jgi:hypothetical protein
LTGSRHYSESKRGCTGPDNLMGLCPFHDDHDPSFGVTPSKNLWNCLAGCGGGDVIELVMWKENVSFRRAVDILQERLGIVPEAPTIETRTGTTHPVLVPPSETELADHALLGHVLDFYHQTFCDDGKAMRYLQSRRCFDPEAGEALQDRLRQPHARLPRADDDGGGQEAQGAAATARRHSAERPASSRVRTGCRANSSNLHCVVGAGEGGGEKGRVQSGFLTLAANA